MAHIHTRPGEFDLTVSAFVVRAVDGRRAVLFHRHKTLGVWMQPGGHVELDETPWQAVTHELLEETGYDIGQLRVLQPALRPPAPPGLVQHPQPVSLRSFRFGDLPHFHTDIAFAFVADDEPRYAVGEGESHELAWLTRDRIEALPPDETYEDVRQLALYVIGDIMDEWRPVPVPAG